MGNHFTAEVKLEHGVYFPGNLVRGTATIKIDKPTECLAARISCRGIERAICVTEGTEHLHQDTFIFKETLTLFGHPTSDVDETPIEVPAGVYTYPFAFQLPMHLPNSVRMTNWASGGVEIRYSVNAFVKLGADKFDEGHTDFTVITPINLRDAANSPPALCTDLVHLSAHLAKQGTCGVSVHLRRSIYTADETIEGRVVIDNHDGQIPIDHVSVQLACHCDTSIDKSIANSMYDLAGNATAETLIRTKLSCKVEPGTEDTVQLSLKLPHVIQYASYPSMGKHYTLRHELLFEIGGKRIAMPIFIAQCADPKNRFAYHVPSHPCHSAIPPVEYKYTVPTGYTANVCPSLSAPPLLPAQPLPVASTPQAVGDGPLLA